MDIDLTQFGLTKNESFIYLYLLKQGATTTGAIIKNTKISNSRVYDSLHSLISKGLVSYTIQKKGKYFEACEPQKFTDIEDEKKKQLEMIIPHLRSMMLDKKSETTSAIYEGFEGFKTAFKKIIDDCPKNGLIYVLGFSVQQFATPALRTFILNMNLKSAQKKQKLQILLDSSAKGTLGKDRISEKYSEVRYMPEGYISPIAIDIFEDYVYLFLWDEKPFVFMIKNKKISESFKIYFSFLWKISKK